MTGDDVEKVTALEGQVTDLEAQIDSLSKMLSEASKNNPELAKAIDFQTEAMAKIEQLTAALEKAMEDKEEMEEELEEKEKALRLAKEMTDDEKSYCADKSSEETAAFMAKPKDEREEEMKAKEDEVAKNDATVVISGRTIRKSAVGEDAFAIMKAQAEEIEKNAKILATEIQKREDAELQKRADDEFQHVPGTVEERAKMLGAIAKMDEPLRKSFEAVFTASEKLAKAGFGKLGSSGSKDTNAGAVAKAADDFMSKADEIATREKVTKTQAIQKARQKYPELFKAYQEHEAS